MVVSSANDQVEKIQEIHTQYLTEFLTYCVYELDHAHAEKAQMEWEEQQRKLKRH